MLLMLGFTVLFLLGQASSDRSASDVVRTTGRCRAHCLDRFAARMNRLTDRSCLGNSDCFMCWENCAMMSRSWKMWGLMCQDESICFPGCRASCHYYSSLMEHAASPPLHWNYDGELTVDASIRFGQVQLRWPTFRPYRESVDHPYLVFLIFWQPKGFEVWKPVKQTIELEATIKNPEIVFRLGKIKLIAVSALGPVGSLEWPEEKPTVAPSPAPGPNETSTDGNLPNQGTDQKEMIVTISFVVTFAAVLFFGAGLAGVYIWYKPQRNNVVLGGRHYAFRDKNRGFKKQQSRRRSLKGPKGGTSSTTQLMRTDSLASVQIHKIQRPAPATNKVAPPKPPRTFGWRMKPRVGEPQVIAIIEGQKHDVVTVNHVLAKRILEAQPSITV